MKENRQTPHLSVVIPVYNEENRIRATLDLVLEYLERQDYTWEVLVVDDGCTDHTNDIVQQRFALAATDSSHPCVQLLHNPGNRGKGYSIRHGLTAGKGAYRLFTDADNSTPIEEIEKFWPYFQQGYQVVIGSRALKDSNVEVHQAWYRELMGRIFNLAVQTIALPGIHDTQCGFKAFTRQAAEITLSRQTIERWGFDAELLFIARRFKLPIAEVPIRWLNSPDSRISSIRDSSQMLKELLSIRWNALRGRYR